MSYNSKRNEAPHHRIRLETLIADYKRGYLTAKGAIAYWVHIRIKEGWELNFNAQEISEMFGMGRSTFWAVLKQLREEGKIDYQDKALSKLRLLPVPTCLKNESDALKTSQASQIQDVCLENEAVVLNSMQESQVQDEKEPEPLPVEEPVTLSDSSSDFLPNSLSSVPQEEREEFVEFVQKEYGKPIKSLNAFLRGEHFTDWWDKFLRATGRIWRSHPNFDKWVAYIKAEGMRMFQYFGDDEFSPQELTQIYNYIEANGFLEATS